MRAVVIGRVQGVGFRYHTRGAAAGFRVSGFVRNLPDGSVEVEAQGTAEEVEDFLAAVRRGPPGSRVDAFRVEPIPVITGDRGFHIGY